MDQHRAFAFRIWALGITLAGEVKLERRTGVHARHVRCQLQSSYFDPLN